MTITQLQTWVKNDWEQHSGHSPSVELQLLYMIEEFGEIAEAIRKNEHHKDRVNKQVDLGSEMADMMIALTTLANHFEIDLQTEVAMFQERMAQRHADGF